MYWYILFVRTGREYRVEYLLKELLDKDVFTPFIPLQEYLFRSKGTIEKNVKPLFPGYVFIESEISGQKFIERLNAIIYASLDIVRIMRYSDTEIAIKEYEKQMLLSLCNDDHCIESSSGIKEGNRIHITDGPLKGWESIVKKVDRHKRLAWIEIEFMGDRRLVSVGLEVVEKV